MTTNISFDEDVLIRSISNAADSVVLLTTALATMQIELTNVLVSLNTFSSSISGALAQSLRDTATDGITMVTVLSSVSESVSFLANAFTILSSAEGAFKALSPVVLALKQQIGAIVLSVQLYTTSMVGGTAVTNVFTIATGLLKMAMDNLPFIAICTAVALLVAAVVIAIQHFNKASETQKRLNAETQALKESTDELNKSLEESKAAYAASTSKIQTNAGAAEILAQKIYALSEEENKSAEAKRQLSVLVDQLNSTMPGLNLLYDEEADCLSQTAAQVYALIEAKKEELLQQAAAEKAVELAKERLDVEQ